MSTSHIKKSTVIQEILKKHKKLKRDAYHEANQILKDYKERINESQKQFSEDYQKELVKYSEIEDILIENDIINEPKRFESPETEYTLEFIDSLIQEIKD